MWAASYWWHFPFAPDRHNEWHALDYMENFWELAWHPRNKLTATWAWSREWQRNLTRCG